MQARSVAALLGIALTSRVVEARADAGRGTSIADAKTQSGGTDAGLPRAGSSHRASPQFTRDGVPLALLASFFIHVEDSDGTRSKVEDDAVLLFHPNGMAFLIFPYGELKVAGRFTYSGGYLTLRFKHRPFVREGRFLIDLSAPTIELPFQCYSEAKGSSKWRAEKGEDRITLIITGICDGMMGGLNADKAKAMRAMREYLEVFTTHGKKPMPSVFPASPVMPIRSFEFTEDGDLKLLLDYPEGLNHLFMNLCSCYSPGCL